ncbi:phospholipase effector Tle1 domain-containing protein [Lonepinella sp. MS14435]|uniref:phospholipase effector Tle1 domain-containing protein n=1 Tax=Lonepinella sp. MS14435 TaxID=3003618 RepID=UPI0036DF7879
MTCKVIRVGMFFDGTGNNLYNDSEGRSQNGLSNIAKLYKLYRDGETVKGQKLTECQIVVKAIYIEGVGTKKNKEDYTTGLAFGSGGAQRIRYAIETLKEILKQYPQREYQRQIDVFGFSRGAAMARDFINTLANEEIELNYQIKFVGLFDTVGSFGNPGDDYNWKPIKDTHKESDLKLIVNEIRGKTPSLENYEAYNFNLAPYSAEQIVHFVALDEYRENFPLTDTNGAGMTYAFIGAHSDVGGGYREIETETVGIPPNRNMDLKSYEKQLNQQEQNNLNSSIQQWTCHPPITAYMGRMAAPAHCSATRIVGNALQDIALIVMHKLAFHGLTKVPFRDIDPLPEMSNWTDELKQYYYKALNDLTNLKSYLNQDVAEDNGETGNNREARSRIHLNILSKYGHNSSMVSCKELNGASPLGLKNHITYSLDYLPLKPRVVGENRVFKRRVFNNKPALAVKKS